MPLPALTKIRQRRLATAAATFALIYAVCAATAAQQQDHADAHPSQERMIAVMATVTDAESGKPVTDFTVREYNTIDPDSNDRSSMELGYSDVYGTFLTSLRLHNKDSDQQGWRIAVSARGYIPQEQVVRIDASSPVRLEYKLKRGAPLTGQLTTKDGTPVANAQVAMLSRDGDRYLFRVVDGELNDHRLITGKTQTAADGSFTFPTSGATATLLALADNGYATASYTPENTEPLHLTLIPWGQISGTLTRNSQASARGQTLFSTSSSPESNGVSIRFRSNAMTDANGKFHLLKVAAGENTLRYIHALPAAEPSELNFSGPALITTVKPGEQSILNYDGRGMLVTGELGLGAMGKDYQWGISDGFLTALEPLEALKDIPHTGLISYVFNIAKDGTFHIDGVLPGVYNIRIFLHSPSETKDPFAAVNAIADTTVTIPAGKTGEVVNIGMIEVRPEEDTPASTRKTERN